MVECYFASHTPSAGTYPRDRPKTHQQLLDTADGDETKEDALSNFNLYITRKPPLEKPM